MEMSKSMNPSVNLYNQTVLNLLWDNKIKLVLFTTFTLVGYVNIPKLHKMQDDLRRKQLHNNQYLSLNEISERPDIFDKIIDVRSIEEYNKGHVTNSIHIDYKEVVSNQKNDFLKNHNINSKDTILLYCKTGRRASLVATHMIEKLNYNKKNIYITNASYKDLENIFHPTQKVQSS